MIITLNLVIRIALIMFCGMLLKKLKLVSDTCASDFSAFVFNLILPCLVIDSFTGSFSPELFSQIPKILLLYLIFMSVLFACAAVVNRLCGNTHDAMAKAVRYAVISPNISFIGLPLIMEFFGSDGVIVYSIIMIPTRILVFGFTPFLMAHSEEKTGVLQNIRNNWRNIMNPPTLAIPVSILLYLLHVRLPQPVAGTFSALASMASPMGMLLCGLMLADLKINVEFSNPRLYVMVLTRMIAAPAAALAVLWLLGRYTDLFSFMLLKIGMIFCCMPIAVTMTIYADRYDCEPRMTVLAVFLSTLLGIVTIPAFLALFDRLVAFA